MGTRFRRSWASPEKAMVPHSSTLAWKNPMDGGAWWAAVHGFTRSQTQLSDFTFTFHFHALEKEMATHPSIPAWRIPGTGEPGGLPSVRLYRVGHDWSNLAAAAAAVGFPGDWGDKEPACHAGDSGDMVRFLDWEDPLEEAMAVATPVFLPGESHGQRNLVGYSL